MEKPWTRKDDRTGSRLTRYKTKVCSPVPSPTEDRKPRPIQYPHHSKFLSSSPITCCNHIIINSRPIQYPPSTKKNTSIFINNSSNQHTYMMAMTICPIYMSYTQRTAVTNTRTRVTNSLRRTVTNAQSPNSCGQHTQDSCDKLTDGCNTHTEGSCNPHGGQLWQPHTGWL